jgi:hypothetical protein
MEYLTKVLKWNRKNASAAVLAPRDDEKKITDYRDEVEDF